MLAPTFYFLLYALKLAFFLSRDWGKRAGAAGGEGSLPF